MGCEEYNAASSGTARQPEGCPRSSAPTPNAKTPFRDQSGGNGCLIPVRVSPVWYLHLLHPMSRASGFFDITS